MKLVLAICLAGCLLGCVAESPIVHSPDLSGTWIWADKNEPMRTVALSLVSTNFTWASTRPIIETLENIKSGERHQERTRYHDECTGSFRLTDRSMEFSFDKPRSGGLDNLPIAASGPRVITNAVCIWSMHAQQLALKSDASMKPMLFTRKNIVQPKHAR
jgi:hypothetical protein